MRRRSFLRGLVALPLVPLASMLTPSSPVTVDHVSRLRMAAQAFRARLISARTFADEMQYQIAQRVAELKAEINGQILFGRSTKPIEGIKHYWIEDSWPRP